jgi:hypothetical protein
MSPVIRYRIKRTAQAGKLGTPEMVAPNIGRVKYRPPAGTGPGEDSFSYQVQSAEGVSAPAEVHITLTDKPPHVLTPNDIEFGELLPGHSAQRSLDVQNIGGGMAEGRLQVPEGWTLEGDPAYHVGAGEKQTFTLTFKAEAVGRYTGDIEYTGNPDRATDLNVEVVAPIAVTSGTVELREAGEMRIGTIHVENRTDGARTLKVTPGPGLDTDATVTAPGKGGADILVRAKAGNGEVNDKVTVEGEGFTAEVPVHATAVMEPGPVAIAQATPGQTPPARTPQPVETPEVTAPVTQTLAASAEAVMPQMNLTLPAPEGDQQPHPPGRRVWALMKGPVTEKGAIVGCNFKGTQPARSYRLELQTVTVDPHGNPVVVWNPFTRAMLQEKGTMVVAQIVDLQPGRLYVVRLVGLDDQGKVIESSSAGQIWTALPKRERGGWWAAAAVVAAGGGIWWWRKRGSRGTGGRGWT